MHTGFGEVFKFWETLYFLLSKKMSLNSFHVFAFSRGLTTEIVLPLDNKSKRGQYTR